MEPDLGALFHRITQRLIAAELPLLEAQGLTMWEYVVLSQLGRDAAPTQLALATAIGYDKTRLIKLLDGLERQGLLVRAPAPEDRRARVVELTAEGRRRLAAARAAIRAMEDELLGDLDGAQLRATLSRLL